MHGPMYITFKLHRYVGVLKKSHVFQSTRQPRITATCVLILCFKSGSHYRATYEPVMTALT